MQFYEITRPPATVAYEEQEVRHIIDLGLYLFEFLDATPLLNDL